MELKCRNCGKPITAENINIQEMMAVCGHCNHVFAFGREAFARKRKPHKLKAPKHLRVDTSDEQVELSYQMTLGPGPKFGLLLLTIGFVFLMGIIPAARADGAPRPVLLIFGLIALVFAYLIAVIASTTTRITADDEAIEVKTGPLPFPFSDDKSVPTQDVARIFWEQTMEAWPPGMPAHHVHTELRDGSRATLVTSLPQAHAHFIARTLTDFLDSGDPDYAADDVPAGAADDVADDADDIPTDDAVADDAGPVSLEDMLPDDDRAGRQRRTG